MQRLGRRGRGMLNGRCKRWLGCACAAIEWGGVLRCGRPDVQRNGRRGIVPVVVLVAAVMIVGVLGVGCVVARIGFRRAVVVAVALTGYHAHRGGQGDHADRAEQHCGTRQPGNRLALQPAIPNPAGTHHDINLHQQRRQVGALHHFGLARMRAEWGTRSARQSPQGDGANIEDDPRRQNRKSRPDQDHACPDQLEQRECREERSGQRPFLPVRRNDREVDNCRPERRQCGAPSSQPAVCLGRCFDSHCSMMTAPPTSRRRRTQHLNPNEIGSSRNPSGDMTISFGPIH